MFKKLLSGAIACLIVHTTVYVESIPARTQAERQALFAEKVKAGVSKLGVGEDARITVKLRDKTKLAGYVSEVREDSFDITDLKSGIPTKVTYPDVAQAKGHNLSTGAKVAIGVGIGVGIFLIILFWYLETHG